MAGRKCTAPRSTLQRTAISETFPIYLFVAELIGELYTFAEALKKWARLQITGMGPGRQLSDHGVCSLCWFTAGMVVVYQS